MGLRKEPTLVPNPSTKPSLVRVLPLPFPTNSNLPLSNPQYIRLDDYSILPYSAIPTLLWGIDIPNAIKVRRSLLHTSPSAVRRTLYLPLPNSSLWAIKVERLSPPSTANLDLRRILSSLASFREHSRQGLTDNKSLHLIDAAIEYLSETVKRIEAK